MLCSGWADRRRRGEPVDPHRTPLRPWVCRSSDGGATWTAGVEFPAPPAGGIGAGNELIPFGNIRPGEDGSLRVAAYLRKGDARSCFMLRSRDDGRTWLDPVPLHPGGNETDILHLGGGRWLAACREFRRKPDVHLELFASDDDGRTWSRRMPLTLPRQVTGHLARLADGRILLSHGNRCWNNFGVDARISEDEGKTWGRAGPHRALPALRLRVSEHGAACRRSRSDRLLHADLGGLPLRDARGGLGPGFVRYGRHVRRLGRRGRCATRSAAASCGDSPGPARRRRLCGRAARERGRPDPSADWTMSRRRCETPEAMVRFYRALGFRVNEGDRICSVHCGDHKINFHRPELWQSGTFSLRAPEARPPCGDFCFVWEGSREALLKTLSDAGAAVIEGPVERAGGRDGGRARGTSWYVHDPDGNLLEFILY